MTYVFFLLVCIVLVIPLLPAQQQNAQAASGEPIDFMTIVIEGKETLHLPKSVLKESPLPPPPYSQAELDSINTLEKVPLFRSQPIEYPRQILHRSPYQALIEAGAGLYGFARMQAHYWKNMDNTRLDLGGLVDRGGPYLPNADYFQAQLKLHVQNAQQHAPDVPQTLSNGILNANIRSWKLFANTAAPNRSLRLLSVHLDHSSVFNTTPYSASLELQGVHMQHAQSSTTEENGLRATLTASVLHRDQLSVGGTVETGIRNYLSTPLHFHMLAATGTLEDSSKAVRAQIGVQLATTSWRETVVTPLLDVRGELQLQPTLRLHAQLHSGQEQITFAELLHVCPYIVSTAPIGTRQVSYRIIAGAQYTPTQSEALELTIGTTGLSSAPYFEPDSSATFALVYTPFIERFAIVRSLFQISTVSSLAFTATVRDARLRGGSRVPYVPLFQANLEFGHVVNQQLSIIAQLGYVSARTAISDESIKLRDYVLLAGRVEYRFSPMVSLVATFDNLLGSTIVLWHGYRERSSFVSLGAVVRL